MEHHESRAAEGEAPAPEAGLGTLEPAELVRAAAELARENPHAALAGAFAVGFLLGGGLTPRVLVSLAVLVGRRYGAEAAQEAVAAAVRQQIDEVSAR
jgi:hypothetical protein